MTDNMNDSMIRVEGVSKKFCRSLKWSMYYGTADLFRNMAGIPFPDDLRKAEFWAVRDMNLEVRKGETLGLIGCNGSGKTTLLRLMNGIFPPDRGRITVRGRVCPLISVGAGFHPHMTGRENIYMNGTILKMTRSEINSRIDSIVDFAEIGDFLDAPVSSYSSGMYVRLGFSIAIHCNPDILLVDEILAVGDLAFTLKCHRKMSELRQNGVTVVIVSHNIQQIRNMCKKVAWLDAGALREMGDTQSVCDLYESEVVGKKYSSFRGSRLSYDPGVSVKKVEFIDSDGRECAEFDAGGAFCMRIHFSFARTVRRPIFTVSVFSLEGILISSNYSHFDGCRYDELSGDGYVDFRLEKIPLRPSSYICSVTVAENEVSNTLVWHEKCHMFRVRGKSTNYGFINPLPGWDLRRKP